MPALGRLLAHENTMSDLLALLIELDPVAVAGRLPGVPASVRPVREAPVRSSRGRLDLQLNDAERVVAVLEMKGASQVHDDQLTRYDRSINGDPGGPSRFFCTFDGEFGTGANGAVLAGWTPIRLVDLFSAWLTSDHPHAAWLAGEIVTTLRTWDSEADGPIAQATGRYVPDIAVRRAAGRMRGTVTPDGRALAVHAVRTHPGEPTLEVRLPFAHPQPNATFGVDVRCQGRGQPDRPWLIRPCVEVYPPDSITAADRVLAHDLATSFGELMGHAAVLDALIEAGSADLADALSFRAPRHDGFRRPPDQARLDDWSAQLHAGNTATHPVFFHDEGVRLATQFNLESDAVTPTNLARLCTVIIEHLARLV